MKRILLTLSLAFALPVFATQAIAADPITEETAAAQLAELEGQALVDAVMALIASVDSNDEQSIKAILSSGFRVANDFEDGLITQAALNAGITPALIVAAAKQARERAKSAKLASCVGVGAAECQNASQPHYSNASDFSGGSSYGTGGS